MKTARVWIPMFAVLSVLIVASAEAASVDCEPARCALQAALETDCPCSLASNHGRYVSCVARTVNKLARAGAIPKECKGRVRNCSARSICGKAGFVTCLTPTSTCDTSTGTCTENASVACLTDLDCGSRCKIRRSAELCAERGGTTGTSTTCCADCGAP